MVFEPRYIYTRYHNYLGSDPDQFGILAKFTLNKIFHIPTQKSGQKYDAITCFSLKNLLSPDHLYCVYHKHTTQINYCHHRVNNS